MASSVNSNATTDDLAQAILLGTDTSTQDSKAAAVLTTSASTSTPDAKSLAALTGPAEMFVQAPRHGVERADTSSLTTHVRDPRWADDLGNRLASMVRTGESSASLQLTPVDLGPLEVKVAVRDNQASVHFGATNAETRALLEASIPRLREMLASQGFQLMDSSVSHGFARPTRHESAGTPRVDDVGESPSVAPATHITGLLDLYA
jgi:flagellar hook-length control protein FliK